uniref:Uncharacterized protein n=1 Tax=Arundo donax TaxID=35708 RepID=A0A0A9BK35_ARUDO
MAENDVHEAERLLKTTQSNHCRLLLILIPSVSSFFAGSISDVGAFGGGSISLLSSFGFGRRDW